MTLLLLALLGCGSSSAPDSPPLPDPRPVPPPGTPSVVVVLCDTLRADALGVYGATRGGVSPHIDALAAQSVRFKRAWSPNAWTVPSVASVFTATSPQTHGVLRFREEETVDLERIPEELHTLAEHFQEAGYTTAALLKTGVISADHGFGQGFETFEVVPGDKADGATGAELTAAAVGWLTAHANDPRPHLLYLHYMDPHSPYRAPPGAPDWHSAHVSETTGAHGDLVAFKKGLATATAGDKAALRARYDEEVHTFDAALGALLANIPDDTVVVLLADHGEQIGEHGGWIHEHLWPENVHVPLIIRAPGISPSTVSTPVSTQDLAPTLAALAGLPVPPGWSQARDLSPALRGEALAVRPVFSEYGTQRALLLADAYAYQTEDGSALYDLGADPRATQAVDEPEKLAELLALIDAHIGATRAAGRAITGRAVVPIDDEHRELLRKLGYLD